MQDTHLIMALRNATAKGDAREIIALTKQIDEKDLARNLELEEAYRMAMLQAGD